MSGKKNGEHNGINIKEFKDRNRRHASRDDFWRNEGQRDYGNSKPNRRIKKEIHYGADERNL